MKDKFYRQAMALAYKLPNTKNKGLLVSKWAETVRKMLEAR